MISRKFNTLNSLVDLFRNIALGSIRFRTVYIVPERFTGDSKNKMNNKFVFMKYVSNMSVAGAIATEESAGANDSGVALWV